MWEIALVFWKEPKMVTKLKPKKMRFLAFSAYQYCVAMNRTQQLNFVYAFKSIETSDTSMNEMQTLVFE